MSKNLVAILSVLAIVIIAGTAAFVFMNSDHRPDTDDKDNADEPVINDFTKFSSNPDLSWKYDKEKLTITGSGWISRSDMFELGNDTLYAVKVLQIDSGVYGIGHEAFTDLISLEEVKLPNSLKKIQYKAFTSCTKLTKVNLPEGLETIENQAFYFTSLKQVDIPSSLRTIGDASFACFGLKTVTFRASNCADLQSLDDGIILSSPFKSLIKNENSYGGKIDESGFAVRITSNVERVPACLFMGSNISSINLENGVQIIGKGVFYECDYLETISLPDSVVKIEKEAFAGCHSLFACKLSSNLQYIERLAFYKCSSLSSIELGSSLLNIEDYAFGECTNLKSVINHSSLPIESGSSEYGQVAMYAEAVINS